MTILTNTGKKYSIFHFCCTIFFELTEKLQSEFYKHLHLELPVYIPLCHPLHILSESMEVYAVIRSHVM